MTMNDAFLQAIDEIMLPKQHQLSSDEKFSIIYCVLCAIKQRAAPSAEVQRSWEGDDLDSTTRLHRDMWRRTTELARVNPATGRA